MNARYTVLAAAVAGFALGAITLDQLHAQAKPPVYIVGEIDMKNPDGYQNDYSPKARAVIKDHGGRILAAGSNFVVLEGEPPKSRVVIQQWDSAEQYQKYRASDAFTEVRKLGNQYATFRSYLMPGVPQP